MRPLMRIVPHAPPEAYKTYQVVSPKETHMRPATCEEVDCGAFLRGWGTVIDVASELGQKQADYIRKSSGRVYTEDREGSMITFTFSPGQSCFGSHTTHNGRPEIYVVRGGDWRGYGESRRHSRAEDWVDDFRNHQQSIVDRQQRG